MNTPPTLCGCVLAGGRSSRMGRDKAALSFNGRTFLERAWDLLRPLCSRCLVSTVRERPYPPFPCVYDRQPGHGPIGGIIACLEEAARLGHAGILAVACDLPLLRQETLRRLLRARGDGRCHFYLGASGRVEMLAGIYSLAALPFLQKAEAGGHFGLYRALPPDLLSLLAAGPDEEEALFNCNRREDLEKLNKRGAGA